MDIQARKIHFVQEFLQVTDETIIARFEKILRIERKKKISKEQLPMSMIEFNDIIDNSENDFKNERTTEARKLLDQIASW